MIVMVTGPSHYTNYYLIFSRINYWHTEGGGSGNPISLLVVDGNGIDNSEGAGVRGRRAADELGIEWVVETDGLPVGAVDVVLAFFEKSDGRELARSAVVREALDRGVLVELASDEGIVFPYTGAEGD